MEKLPGEGTENLYLVGKILSAHGIRGGVTVQVWTHRLDRFQKGQRLWSLADTGNISLTVREIRIIPRGLILRFDEIENRTDAEHLTGTELAIFQEDRDEAETGAHYVSDLLGFQVVTDSDRELGKITEVISQPHHDLFVVTGPYGEILVPAVREFIRNIDKDRHRIVVQRLEAFWDGKIS